jgi:hypothetical protein
MAGTTGLEPATSAVTGQRSNQLSYVPKVALGNYGVMSHRMSIFYKILSLCPILPFVVSGTATRLSDRGKLNLTTKISLSDLKAVLGASEIVKIKTASIEPSHASERITFRQL